MKTSRKRALKFYYVSTGGGFYVVKACNKKDVIADAKWTSNSYYEIRLATQKEIAHYEAERGVEEALK